MMSALRRNRHESELFRILDAIDQAFRLIPRDRAPKDTLLRYERAHAAIFRENEPVRALDRAARLLEDVTRFAEVTRGDDYARLVHSLARMDLLDSAGAVASYVEDPLVSAVAFDAHGALATRRVMTERGHDVRRRLKDLEHRVDEADGRARDLEEALGATPDSPAAPLVHATREARREAASLLTAIEALRKDAESARLDRVTDAVAEFTTARSGFYDRVGTLTRRVRDLDDWIRPYGNGNLDDLAKVLGKALEPVRRIHRGSGGSGRQAVLGVLRAVLEHPSPEVKERLVQHVYESLAREESRFIET